MKASSCGLETRISKLTDEEIKRLKSEGVRRRLKFIEPSSDGKKRKIPFTLYYSPNQRELVEVRVIPEDTYFGYAKIIEFSINKEYYKFLESIETID